MADIIEFSISAGKLYLSPIIDCFDGLAISLSVGTSPGTNLMNSMFDQATKALKDEEHHLLHSYRGTHYRWLGWLLRISKAGITPSMSKKMFTRQSGLREIFGQGEESVVLRQILGRR